MKNKKIPLNDPGKLIHFLYLHGHNPSNLINHNKPLSTTEKQVLHAFNICWTNSTALEGENSQKTIKSKLSQRQYQRINASLRTLNLLFNYNPSTFQEFQFKFINEENRKQGLALIQIIEKSITDYQSLRQKIMRFFGYLFGFIFAFANGANNGKAMASTIIAICVLCGGSAFSLISPLVLIPALLIGIGSFVINFSLALKASPDSFSLILGDNAPFSSLLSYTTRTGRFFRFNLRHALSFFFFGMIPAFFSAFCKGILAGFVILLTLSCIVSGPIASTIAIGTMIAFTAALTMIYLRNATKLFHFEENISKWSAVKNYLQNLVFPIKHGYDIVNEHVCKLTSGISLNSNEQSTLANYKSRLNTITKILSLILIPISVVGIALTIYAAVVAAPALFPFMTLPIAITAGVLALPGQIPFYNISAAKIAAKLATFFTPIPKELKYHLNQKINNQKNENEQEVILSRNLIENTQTKKTQNSIIEKSKNAVYKFSQYCNPVGNGAIAMVSTDFFHPLANLILKPITFLTASISSATLGFALDDDDSQARYESNLRYKALFNKQPVESNPIKNMTTNEVPALNIRALSRHKSDSLFKKANTNTLISTRKMSNSQSLPNKMCIQ